MIDKDKPDFLTLLADVYAFYRQPFSEFAGNVWWEAMRPYSAESVRLAFSRHCVNPDSGQFLPKPADVVKMLSGTTGDAALVAWSKVERAVRSIGQYVNVVFDDALIHRVVSDMGGWVRLAGCPSEDDFVFVGKEFQNRYRGFAMRSEIPDYPHMLIGLAQAQNTEQGRIAFMPPRMIGNPEKCEQVYAGGTGAGYLQVTNMPSRVRQVEHKKQYRNDNNTTGEGGK